jgi:hypothetical protein
MRTFTQLAVAAVVLMLSGCAGWVVFGHTIEGKQPAAEVQPTPAPQPTPTSRSAPATQAASAPPPSSATQLATATRLVPAPLPTTPPSGASPETLLLKAVTVTFTPTAQQKIAAEPQFKQTKLLTAIESELRAHKLLDASDPRASGSLAISIDDFADKPTSNAVVFGYILGTGTLTGNMELHATAGGQELKDSRITAESRLAKSASDGQANPFAPLYHRFAAATVNSLTGKPTQPDEPHWGQDRPTP